MASNSVANERRASKKVALFFQHARCDRKRINEKDHFFMPAVLPRAPPTPLPPARSRGRHPSAPSKTLSSLTEQFLRV